MSRIIATPITLDIRPKHLNWVGSIDISTTTALAIDLTDLGIFASPPKALELSAITIQVINERYIHLEDVTLTYNAEKLITVTGVDFDYTPPTYNALTGLTIQHRQLRIFEVACINLDFIFEPTRTKSHIVNIYATRIPRMALFSLDVAFGLPSKAADIAIPLVTNWAKTIKTEISGSTEHLRRGHRVNIRALYESGQDYFDLDTSRLKYRTNIKTGIGRNHFLHTAISSDYDSWFNSFTYIPTSIISAADKFHFMATHLFALSGNKLKMRNEILTIKGSYTDNLAMADISAQYVDYGAKKIWLNGRLLCGYTEFNNSVKYGYFLQIPYDLPENVRLVKAYVGVPLASTHLLDLALTVNLLNTNSLNLKAYTLPSEITNLFGILMGAENKILKQQLIGYLDITSLLIKFKEIYANGQMTLQVAPSQTLLHEDALLQNPFNFRMMEFNLTGKLIYKIFYEVEEL